MLRQALNRMVQGRLSTTRYIVMSPQAYKAEISSAEESLIKH